jgi:hypothetical protein
MPLPEIRKNPALLRLRMSLITALLWVAVPAQAEQITLEDRRTAFQRLTVIEDTQRRERYLYSDDQRYLQGMILLRRPDELAPAYLRSALLGLLFAPANPSSMLFVGLGTGSLPRYLSARYPHARLDAVEINPEVPPIARRPFARRGDDAAAHPETENPSSDRRRSGCPGGAAADLGQRSEGSARVARRTAALITGIQQARVLIGPRPPPFPLSGPGEAKEL